MTDLQAEEDISQSQTEELKYGGVGHEDQSDKHTSSLSENEDHNDNEGDEAATKNESCDDESEYQDDSDIESDKDAEEDTDEEDDEEVTSS